MISRGDQQRASQLEELAAMANGIPELEGRPYKFIRRIHGYRASAAENDNALERIRNGAQVGEYAINWEKRYSDDIPEFRVYKLEADPSTDSGNWRFLSSSAEFFVGLDFPTPSLPGQLALPANFAGANEYLREVPISFAHVARIRNGNLEWQRYFGWLTEINRLKHYLLKLFATADMGTTLPNGDPVRIGIQERCIVSGPWPLSSTTINSTLPGQPREVLSCRVRDGAGGYPQTFPLPNVNIGGHFLRELDLYFALDDANTEYFPSYVIQPEWTHYKEPYLNRYYWVSGFKVVLPRPAELDGHVYASATYWSPFGSPPPNVQCSINGRIDNSYIAERTYVSGPLVRVRIKGTFPAGETVFKIWTDHESKFYDGDRARRLDESAITIDDPTRRPFGIFWRLVAESLPAGKGVLHSTKRFKCVRVREEASSYSLDEATDSALVTPRDIQNGGISIGFNHAITNPGVPLPHWAIGIAKTPPRRNLGLDNQWRVFAPQKPQISQGRLGPVRATLTSYPCIPENETQTPVTAGPSETEVGMIYKVCVKRRPKLLGNGIYGYGSPLNSETVTARIGVKRADGFDVFKEITLEPGTNYTEFEAYWPKFDAPIAYSGDVIVSAIFVPVTGGPIYAYDVTNHENYVWQGRGMLAREFRDLQELLQMAVGP
jgi:hypothetical protein